MHIGHDSDTMSYFLKKTFKSVAAMRLKILFYICYFYQTDADSVKPECTICG